MKEYDTDNRLKQDSIEREKKANASTGMIIAIVIVLLGVAIGAYLYNQPRTVDTAAINSNVEQTVPANNRTATSPQ